MVYENIDVGPPGLTRIYKHSEGGNLDSYQSKDSVGAVLTLLLVHTFTYFHHMVSFNPTQDLLVRWEDRLQDQEISPQWGTCKNCRGSAARVSKRRFSVCPTCLPNVSSRTLPICSSMAHLHKTMQNTVLGTSYLHIYGMLPCESVNLVVNPHRRRDFPKSESQA
jgi:hypothetical protein